ncbi:MAG: hypothetical protein AB7L91_06240 [Dehalococcoidia bacterium]
MHRGIEQARERVQPRADGWYETTRERVVPLWTDVYDSPFAASYRELLREVDQLRRRGA